MESLVFVGASLNVQVLQSMRRGYIHRASAAAAHTFFFIVIASDIQSVTEIAKPKTFRWAIKMSSPKTIRR